MDLISEAYDAIDKQFVVLTGKKDMFLGTSQVSDPTEYEMGIPSQIQPAGWVQNADPDLSGGASVTIDSDGITILNGKIYLQDYGGDSVLSPAGFDGSWISFINSGFYNGNFVAGTTNDITAATETGGADTIAEYLASLSSDLPYWIVAGESGAGTFKRVADATAPSGFALQWSGNETAEVYQDVPIVPGQKYAIYLVWKSSGVNGSNTHTTTIGAQFLDKDHAAITGSALIETGLSYSTTQTNYLSEWLLETGVAPASARYMRSRYEVARTAGSPTVYLASMQATPLGHFGELNIIQDGIKFKDLLTDTYPYFQIDRNGTLMWHEPDGATAHDVELYRESANVLAMAVGDGLRIRNNNDADVTSNNHGLTIGEAGGQTIAIDNNEILSRNAGSTATLFLNNDGGGVTMGSGTFTMGGGTFNLTDGIILMSERADPAAPSADDVRMYTRDNGAGKTQIVARFNTGAIQVIATQP
jgi:hypothetical protein